MELAAEEIDHLLKRGAYDVFREDDEEGKDFVEASIDDIMKRAATKVGAVVAIPGIGQWLLTAVNSSGAVSGGVVG